MLFRYYNLFSLQTPHVRRTNTQHLTNDSGRASLYISRKGSMTLETAMAVPFFLCAVTALLYLFVFTAQNGQAYRRLMEKAEMLAVTAGQITGDDPYIRLYDYETAELPFVSLFPVRNPVIRKVEIRGWTGYTGETFTGNGQEELVYKTPGGEVYHKSRDCTYLKLSVHMVSAAELPNCRNESGGKYDPCEYCVRKESPGRMVYIADYGVSYHNSRNCQGLKRTVMAVPLSHTEGLRCCSRCGS